MLNCRKTWGGGDHTEIYGGDEVRKQRCVENGSAKAITRENALK